MLLLKIGQTIKVKKKIKRKAKGNVLTLIVCQFSETALRLHASENWQTIKVKRNFLDN